MPFRLPTAKFDPPSASISGVRANNLFGDIRNPRLLYAKAALLLCIGILASVLLLIDQPTFSTAALLAVAIWGFCRAYYFAFYVVQHYADPDYRFAGLLSFIRYACRRHNVAAPSMPRSTSPIPSPPAPAQSSPTSSSNSPADGRQ